MVVGLGCLVAGACLASSPPDSSGRGDPSASGGSARIELCVRNDGRLPATIQYFRYGEGFGERCRSATRSQLEGTLDVRVDPVAPDGTYFPESLQGILVTATTRAVRITLVAEGIEPYGQSSYRTWDD